MRGVQPLFLRRLSEQHRGAGVVGGRRVPAVRDAAAVQRGHGVLGHRRGHCGRQGCADGGVGHRARDGDVAAEPEWRDQAAARRSAVLVMTGQRA